MNGSCQATGELQSSTESKPRCYYPFTEEETAEFVRMSPRREWHSTVRSAWPDNNNPPSAETVIVEGEPLPPSQLLKKWEDLLFDENENADVLFIVAYQAGFAAAVKAQAGNLT